MGENSSLQKDTSAQPQPSIAYTPGELPRHSSRLPRRPSCLDHSTDTPSNNRNREGYMKDVVRCLDTNNIGGPQENKTYRHAR